jgi:hypothetical protein
VRDFNGSLKRAIDDSVRGVFGPSVLETLYRVLDEKYSVTPDELPYRLETLWDVLEHGLGHVSARTVGRSIARLFYTRAGLKFVSNPDWKLEDYVEEAKRQLTSSTLG